MQAASSEKCLREALSAAQDLTDTDPELLHDLRQNVTVWPRWVTRVPLVQDSVGEDARENKAEVVLGDVAPVDLSLQKFGVPVGAVFIGCG